MYNLRQSSSHSEKLRGQVFIFGVWCVTSNRKKESNRTRCRLQEEILLWSKLLHGFYLLGDRQDSGGMLTWPLIIRNDRVREGHGPGCDTPLRVGVSWMTAMSSVGLYVLCSLNTSHWRTVLCGDRHLKVKGLLNTWDSGTGWNPGPGLRKL